MIANCTHQFRRAVLVAPGRGEHGKKPALVSPFERAPGSVPLVRETGYATVSNPGALNYSEAVA
jgi:hypothetical protein